MERIEKTEIKVAFKTNDGKTFYSEQEALKHEADLVRIAQIETKFKVKDADFHTPTLDKLISAWEVSYKWAYMPSETDRDEFVQFFHLRIGSRSPNAGWNLIKISSDDEGTYYSVSRLEDVLDDLYQAIKEVEGLGDLGSRA